MNEALYDRNIQCPICDNKFVTKKVRTSAIRILKRDEDFCSYYQKENPLFYGVFICWRCGYAALEADFSNIKFDDKEKVKSVITSKWHSRSYGGRRNLDDAIEVHKLALLCYNVLEKKNSLLGKLCLRLSWFYRYKENKEQERKFMKFTIESFENAYTRENIDDDANNEVSILYLLGELNRRIDKYKEAVMWFDKALSNPQIKRKRHIELKARNQWSIAREQYKKQKKP